MAFARDFTPVLAKHSKSFSLVDCISVGVDRMQRRFESMRKQLEASQTSELMDAASRWACGAALALQNFLAGREHRWDSDRFTP
jgi:hypothetical protein